MLTRGLGLCAKLNFLHADCEADEIGAQTLTIIKKTTALRTDRVTATRSIMETPPQSLFDIAKKFVRHRKKPDIYSRRGGLRIEKTLPVSQKRHISNKNNLMISYTASTLWKKMMERECARKVTRKNATRS
jgi:hypothetical protein